jgi:hypothetical protein
MAIRDATPADEAVLGFQPFSIALVLNLTRGPP